MIGAVIYSSCQLSYSVEQWNTHSVYLPCRIMLTDFVVCIIIQVLYIHVEAS